ncbi:MAG: hypothetical protein E7629_09345 [Ruminococcaceae bacterium]|nr:hypothetical protein [Oscillospiraceae bacterium]
MLSSWGDGVAYARCHNVIMRNSDVLDIATMADFFGTAWQVNAILIPNNVPHQKPYLQPVGEVMRLFGKHQGKHALDISYSGDIDAVASRTDNKIYLHIANTNMNASQELIPDIENCKIASARMDYIAESPDVKITPSNPDCFRRRACKILGNTVTLPPAAVAAVEITLKEN